MKLSMEASQ
jgi:hypothetical protein